MSKVRKKPAVRLVKAITLSGKAWAKIRFFMRINRPNELSGFGITTIDDPLFVQDFETIGQVNSITATDFDPGATGKYLFEMSKRGIWPNRCFRVWIHTHPFTTGIPTPSEKDWHTFREKIGQANLSFMIIVSNTGATTAWVRLKNEGLCIEKKIATRVEWMRPIQIAHEKEWLQEAARNLKLQDTGKVKGSSDAVVSRGGFLPLYIRYNENEVEQCSLGKR